MVCENYVVVVDSSHPRVSKQALLRLGGIEVAVPCEMESTAMEFNGTSKMDLMEAAETTKERARLAELAAVIVSRGAER